MEEILTFENVGYFYKNGDKKNMILEDASYVFEKGRLYAVLGPSGSGKTTMLALASALETPKSGEIRFEGKGLREIGLTRYRSNKIGIVFQSYNLLNYMNAVQNVEVSMDVSGSGAGRKHQRALELLEKVGLDREKAYRNINKLSGGEQQRVAIARAISTDALLIMADEPTGNLDAATAEEIMQIFCDLAHKDGKCVIAVTHSADFAKKADVVLALKGGRLEEQKAENQEDAR